MKLIFLYFKIKVAVSHPIPQKKESLVKKRFSKVCAVVLVILTIAYSFWVRNLVLPASAVIDLTQLPKNTLFVPGTGHGESITMPAGVNVGAVVQYEIYGGSGVNTLVLNVYRPDPLNPGFLKREKNDWLRPENVWSDTHFRHVSISSIAISGQVITISPKKDYSLSVFAGILFIALLAGCAGLGEWCEPIQRKAQI